MADTKKVLHTGRYGSRYGRGVKARVLKVELEQRKKHVCPFCEKPKVIRKAAGLFECNSCNASFAGGAYTPTTMSGRLVNRSVKQKQFAALETELTQLKEKKIVEKVKEHEIVKTEKPKHKEKIKTIEPQIDEVLEEDKE
ncbi:MAG: 50S ribosomal protein L37Ae [Candidatus Diapherotrites archaeon]|nr:50S ribosomal protein L37Ae [Candidatus Diapherotrites archaeon]